MELYNLLEGTLVNGDVPLKYMRRKTLPIKKLEEYCAKNTKQTTWLSKSNFLDDLKYLSIRLKSY